ncbi:uncharacterized protein BCR38DRAFT_413377 [Pseudomassariella vexata]|uniref:Uncharacterized protein n=1 Tax=Pseudomassariella vexata TaxID=1141098 RepID=A0A1Y2DHC1_9PEZI|nr:uncharacterized protein BCR38DRAFT_413377 [Pseudomassariella vexata]ORY58526.1 hypothetical protein BCR38DRAFT_413377 [Pseudomassariella vexata]
MQLIRPYRTHGDEYEELVEHLQEPAGNERRQRTYDQQKSPESSRTIFCDGKRMQSGLVLALPFYLEALADSSVSRNFGTEGFQVRQKGHQGSIGTSIQCTDPKDLAFAGLPSFSPSLRQSTDFSNQGPTPALPQRCGPALYNAGPVNQPGNLNFILAQEYGAPIRHHPLPRPKDKSNTTMEASADLTFTNLPSWIPNPVPWASRVIETLYSSAAPFSRHAQISKTNPKISSDGTIIFLCAAKLSPIENMRRKTPQLIKETGMPFCLFA